MYDVHLNMSNAILRIIIVTNPQVVDFQLWFSVLFVMFSVCLAVAMERTTSARE